ncbi:MAG TPA: hypothetical protein VF323_08390 [Candidatus Limnocylindrales bacterium]
MNTLRRPALGALALVLSATVLVACASTTPTGTPSPSLSSSPSAELTASPPPTITPSPTSAPTPTPTPAPTPVRGPLTIAWHRSAAAATAKAGDWGDMAGRVNLTWTKFGDLFVVPVDTAASEAGPQIWISHDALTWQKATIRPAGKLFSVSAVTLGGPGLIAIGSDLNGDSPTDAFWTSTDGLVWNRAKTSGLTPGQDWLLRVTENGYVTWASGVVDVSQYKGPRLDTEQEPRLVASGGSLTAFVNPSDTKHPVEVWTSSGTAGWQQAGVVVKSDGATVLSAAQGAHGWFAIGCGTDCTDTAGWTSSDGIVWQSVDASTVDGANVLVADQAGFVIVGERVTGLGCAVGDSEIFGETWTSSDGRTWHKMPEEPQFNRASMHVLIVEGRSIFGLGLSYTAGGVPKSAVWTATLPIDSVTTAPASTPTPAPSASAGCGN